MEIKEQKSASFFTSDYMIPEDEKVRFTEALNRVGKLTFTVQQDSDGWTAQCNEVDGIIASDTNPNPSVSDIENNIREAIFAAFGVKEFMKSPFFSYSNLPVSVKE